MMRMWTLGLAGLAWCALGAPGALGQQAAAVSSRPVATAAPSVSPDVKTHVHVFGNDLPGPIDSLRDLQDSGKLLYKLLDSNNDGLISRKEATDAGNLMVGGFFFRADANSDGTLTKEEAQAARESLYRQRPLLRVIAERVKTIQPASGNGSPNPASALGALLDNNDDRQLQGAEVRQAVESTVQSFYDVADTNRDGQMSPAEVNAVMLGVARSVANAAYVAADKDNNGSLSQEEFTQSITEPSRVVFTVLDADGDQQLTKEELQRARQIIVRELRQLRVPEPSNSLANILGSGRVPQEVAPVPEITIKPVATQAAPQPAPAPAASGTAPPQ